MTYNPKEISAGEKNVGADSVEHEFNLVLINYKSSKEINEYFDLKKGVGVLSTADVEGNVNAAIYARPHFMDDGTLAFIMRDRLSHHNLQSNPRANYLFKEVGAGYKGKRLFLSRVREEQNTELLESLRRRKAAYGKGEDRYLVFFKLEKELPLVGDGK